MARHKIATEMAAKHQIFILLAIVLVVEMNSLMLRVRMNCLPNFSRRMK